MEQRGIARDSILLLTIKWSLSFAESYTHSAHGMVPGLNNTSVCEDTAGAAFQTSFIVEINASVLPLAVEFCGAGHDHSLDQLLVVAFIFYMDMRIAAVNVKPVMSKLIFNCHCHYSAPIAFLTSPKSLKMPTFFTAPIAVLKNFSFSPPSTSHSPFMISSIMPGYCSKMR